MKIRINISISEEANNQLNQQENKSQYIEDLILGGSRPSEVESSLEEIKSLLSKNISPPTAGSFIPKPPDPLTGYPCCQKRTPCKHWIFDGANESWINVLTGVSRDA